MEHNSLDIETYSSVSLSKAGCIATPGSVRNRKASGTVWIVRGASGVGSSTIRLFIFLSAVAVYLALKSADRPGKLMNG